jgi:hypothetical protein
MRAWIILGVALAGTLLVGRMEVCAQTPIPREHHEWAKFPAGSWKRVRLTSEKLDEHGNVVSTSSTETTTTLISVGDDVVNLRVETLVEVAGKQFNKMPQLVTQGLSGDVEHTATPDRRSVQRGGRDRIKIDGRDLVSEIRTVTIIGRTCQWTSRIHYCGDVAPYVLRRETRSQDIQLKKTNYETQVEVVAVDMPQDVKGEIKPASHIRTVHSTPRGKTVTLEIRCEDVPGGFVAHTGKELDAAGNVVGRSKLELIDYSIAPAGASANTSMQSNYRPIRQRWFRRR